VGRKSEYYSFLGKFTAKAALSRNEFGGLLQLYVRHTRPGIGCFLRSVHPAVVPELINPSKCPNLKR